MLAEADIQLYTENPVEYIRQGDDDVFKFDSVYAPKQDARDILIVVCTKNYESADKSAIVRYFEYCHGLLQKGVEWKAKESILNSLQDLVTKISEVKMI